MRKTRNYWTREKCEEEALKYEHKKDFINGSPGAYGSSRKNGWYDDITKHMKIIGNRYKRCLYVFEFSDNCAYVGLTQNYEERIEYHFNKEKSSVYKKIKISNLIPTYRQLTTYLDKDVASNKEKIYMKEYESNGWELINIKEGGNLGGGYLKWSKEKCQEVALKYKTKKDFYKNDRNCHESARRQGYLNDICEHMISRKYNGYWTEERCYVIAKKYKYRVNFQKENRSCYEISRKEGWLKNICQHMEKPNKKIKWTLEKCLQESQKYETNKDFMKNNKSCYESARVQGFLEKINKHFK